MTRTVHRETFFHINRRLPYALRQPFSVNDHITIGQEENPFFRFYRTYRKAYPVTLDDGQVLQVPALKFLHQVAQGRINAPNLPAIAHDIARHFVTLARELLWEQIRLTEFPEAPSRQRGVWLIPSIDEMADWRNRLECKEGDAHQFLELECTGTVHLCDASLLLGDSESLDDTYRKAREYWSGSMADQGSEPEVLFEGELRVVRVVSPDELA